MSSWCPSFLLSASSLHGLCYTGQAHCASSKHGSPVVHPAWRSCNSTICSTAQSVQQIASILACVLLKHQYGPALPAPILTEPLTEPKPAPDPSWADLARGMTDEQLSAAILEEGQALSGAPTSHVCFAHHVRYVSSQQLPQQV